MLENRKFNIILSLVLAVGLWIYVVGEVNPTAETSMKGIPITYTNVNLLAERNLAVSSSSADSIDLQIKGARSDLGRINRDDIRITADMGTAQKGENEISIQVRVPDGIEVTRKSMNKIVVTVENLKVKKVPVNIVYEGSYDKDREPLTLEMSKQQVTIKGAETLVNSVKSARGSINTVDIGENEKKTRCQLTPVDSRGNQVNRILVEPESVSVTSIISKVKEVELKVPVVDNSDDDTKRTIEKPDKVLIKGRADTLKDITSVTSEPVDLTDRSQGEKISLKLNLPEGITLSNKNQELTVTVKAETPEEHSFSYKASDVTMYGEADGFEYRLPDDFAATVLVSGKKQDVDKVKSNSIKLSVNLSGATQEGDIKTVLEVSCDIPGVTVSVNPETVPVTVKQKAIQEQQ